MVRVLIICLVVICFAVTFVHAEDFVSKNFPPDELIVKSLKVFDRSAKVEIVGKIKESENSYTVYYRTGKVGWEGFVDAMSLIKLDTNIWLIKKGGTSYILQK